MTSEKPLQRTSYRDPNTSDDRVRTGTPTLAENERDMDQYYRPLERIHGSSLHGWGVASRLSVTATLNSPSLTIQPGVALDSSGKHIALAVGGNAEVGWNPTGFSTGATFVPVTTNGVTMPTSGLTGDKYLTIQFWETFDSDSYNTLGIFRYFHTPWLQLLDVAGFTNDGSRVVLAKVSLGTGASAGQVTALTQDLRQATNLPVGSIHLQKSVQSTPAANAAVTATVEAGAIRAHAADPKTPHDYDGLAITVPNASDEVHLECDDGGNFAKVSLGAEKIVARQGNGTESVVIDTEAGSITTPGSVTTSSVTASGLITASSINAQNSVIGNNVSANSATVSGPITAGSLATSGGLTAGSVTASGPVTASSITASGPVTASSVTASSAAVHGTITAGGTTGVNGEVIVNDANNNPAIVLNGDIATVEIGNADSAGVLKILDGTGNAEAGVIRARATGGIDVMAQKVVMPRGDGTDSVVIDTVAGSITATGDISANNGTVNASSLAVSGGVKAAADVYITREFHKGGGSSGLVVLKDQDDNQTLTLDGAGGYITAGSMDIAGGVHIARDFGNVGIGTTTPGSKLDVVQANGAAIRALSGDSNSYTTLSIGRTADEGRIGVAASAGQFANDAVAGDIILRTETTSPHLLFGNGPGNSTMAIHNGNVGIGTTEPTSPLHVNGNISAGSISVNSKGNIGILANAVGAGLWAAGRTGVVASGNLRAGQFFGDVDVDGTLTKRGGSFKIDDPCDPANKYLSHSFVESPDMKNIYDGVTVLDANGEAVVELPQWFEALNKDLRYQLTCIGGYAPVYIAEKVNDNRFKIAGGKPEMEVSWQVTGIRQDAWANAHRVVVEEDKPAEEQGYYLHPELYGESEEKHVRLVRYPETTQLMQPGQQTKAES